MSDITYRMATPDDAALLAGLGIVTFTETFGPLYAPEDLEGFLAEAHDVGKWHDQLSDPDFAVRVAFAPDGGAIGYCKIGPPWLPVETERRSIELRQLYVLQPWHGARISHALMAWAIETAKARGAEEMYLSVYIDNHRARRFYDRYGFVEVGRYAFMVGNQADDDRIMKLDLTA